MKDKNISSYDINKRGFSLVEVLIASFIVAIILGIASTSFLNLSPKYRLKSAVREINSRLNYARYKAIFEGVKVRIKFDEHSYTIETYDEEKNEWRRGREYFLNGVILQANNSPTFHPVGTVSNLASIYISNSWGKYKITLAISGRIKVSEL
jgi:prepilin-type N-terminal cleavage/methylation domain-containing protein